MQPRQFVPPLFVLTLSLLLLTMPIFNVSKILLAGSTLIYALLNLVASVLTARRKQWGLLPVVPVAFTIIHLAYGSGFLLGLAKFWNRWEDRGTRASQATLLRDAAPL